MGFKFSSFIGGGYPNHPPIMWPILRTKPGGSYRGFAIPIFIRNIQYHLTTVDAYADGAIEVWGLVDRELFGSKLRSGWVWPQPPEGGRISVFNLGFCDVGEGKWIRSQAEISEFVDRAIRINNPKMTGLLNLEGSEIEMKGKVKCFKLQCADDCPIRLADDGLEIAGCEVPAFAMSGRECRLTRAFIFSDGTARIGADGETTTQEAIYEAFGSGQLVTSIPDATIVEVEGLGRFTAMNGNWFVRPSERVKEIRDLVAQLAGQREAVAICREAMQAYETNPSEVPRSRLRQAYEAVPEHLRRFCGDMDSKDSQIKRVLYGDKGRDIE